MGSYWHSNLYTNKEKAALEYTDILNKGVAPNFETYHQKIAQHFSIQEIQEIAYIVINMNLWTRLKLAQGQITNYKLITLGMVFTYNDYAWNWDAYLFNHQPNA